MAQSRLASVFSTDAALPDMRSTPVPVVGNGYLNDGDKDEDQGVTRRWLQNTRRLWGCLCCLTRRRPQSSATAASSTESIIIHSPLKATASTPLQGGWDEGVFSSELLKQSIVSRNITVAETGKTITPPRDVEKPSPLRLGTYHGTKLALKQMTKRIETRFESFFDVAGFETSVPLETNIKAKELYTFQKPDSDNYPPHLDIIPKVDQVGLLQIFDFMRLLDTGTLIGSLIPDEILDFIHDDPEGATIKAIETRNNELSKEKKDIFDEDNIGSRPDWWTDAVFAQQQFVGTNPTTIQKASSGMVKEFAELPQANEEMYRILSGDIKSFYVQDCSYFRAAVRADANADMVSNDGIRRLPAAVTLFQLTGGGVLHPLAIAIDFKVGLKSSVVILNQRTSPTAPESEEDWPWRYAKTCAQVSDWLRHEITVHLVNTHLVEEVTIVAAHRAFAPDHCVYRLLQPHWLKTLSANAAARSCLFPNIITKLVGVTDPQLYSFLQYAYKHFDWTGRYAPKDLQARGFPPDQLATKAKFHNYGYGRNIILMWQVLRKFVEAVILIEIHSDEQVAGDEQIEAWSREMRTDKSGQLKSFPKIRTIADLVDAVTMCIHIASPQHTAINYLQSYYMAFVPNKPSAMFAPLPKSLDELKSYKEQDLVDAYPIKYAREWLLGSHVPHLLSYRVAEDQNLLNFALSAAKIATLNEQDQLAAAAAQLYADLMQLVDVFKKNSKDLDDQTKPYDVMDPKVTAVSILL